MCFSFLIAPSGLTLLSETGDVLKRINSSSTDYPICKAILESSDPKELKWKRLQEVFNNPNTSLSDWLASFGISFKDLGALIEFSTHSLKKDLWLPFLTSIKERGSNPLTLRYFFDRLQGNIGGISPIGLTLSISSMTDTAPKVVVKCRMPHRLKEALGAEVATKPDFGMEQGIILFSGYSADEGPLLLSAGNTLDWAATSKQIDAIVSEPITFANGRTYRCEEGTESGWIEDESFDGFDDALAHVSALRTLGAEMRIVNRTTGTTLSV